VGRIDERNEMTQPDDMREEEPRESEPTGKAVAPKTRRAFSKLAMELSQEELDSPGVQKLLLAEITRLEQENFRLSGFQDQFHEADKERDMLKERSRKSVFLEILYSLGLTLGAALMGLTPSFNAAGADGWITLVIGAVMILGAVIARLVRK
jgi:hypothetical protein